MSVALWWSPYTQCGLYMCLCHVLCQVILHCCPLVRVHSHILLQMPAVSASTLLSHTSPSWCLSQGSNSGRGEWVRLRERPPLWVHTAYILPPACFYWQTPDKEQWLLVFLPTDTEN